MTRTGSPRVARLGATRSVRAVADLVLPRTCAGCGADGGWWCAECDRAFESPAHRVVVGREHGSGFPPCCAAAAYRGPAGRALVAWKERGVVGLGPPLAAALARSVAAVLDADAAPQGALRRVALVPVPSRRAAVRARGSDVVADLARAAAGALRREGTCDAVAVPCLLHTRRVVDQTGLGPQDRAANLAGALRARALGRGLLSGRTIVVIDDVVTTGATVAEAARALRVLCPASPVLAAAVATAGAHAASENGGRVVSPARDG